MAQSNFDDVGDFHEKFSLDNVTHRGVHPRLLDEAVLAFRIKFLHEELREFEDACEANDEPAMFDALLDLVYVAMGTAHLKGYPWQVGWNEVQRANMSKQRAAPDGSNSTRLSAFDVIKPEGWQPPDILGALSASYSVCARCERTMNEANVKEIINKHRFVGQTMVDMHCVCGAYLGSRAV